MFVLCRCIKYKNLFNLFPGSVKYISGLYAFVNYSCNHLPTVVSDNRKCILFLFYLMSVFCWHTFSKPTEEYYDEQQEGRYKLYCATEWCTHTHTHTHKHVSLAIHNCRTKYCDFQLSGSRIIDFYIFKFFTLCRMWEGLQKINCGFFNNIL
jgi:hypothetical protein